MKGIMNVHHSAIMRRNFIFWILSHKVKKEVSKIIIKWCRYKHTILSIWFVQSDINKNRNCLVRDLWNRHFCYHVWDNNKNINFQFYLLFFDNWLDNSVSIGYYSMTLNGCTEPTTGLIFINSISFVFVKL